LAAKLRKAERSILTQLFNSGKFEKGWQANVIQLATNQKGRPRLGGARRIRRRMRNIHSRKFYRRFPVFADPTGAAFATIAGTR
jgi:hypothetical protein